MNFVVVEWEVEAVIVVEIVNFDWALNYVFDWRHYIFLLVPEIPIGLQAFLDHPNIGTQVFVERLDHML